MDSTIESYRSYFKKTFFPNTEFDYNDFEKRLMVFFKNPENIKFIEFKDVLLNMARAYRINWGSINDWRNYSNELKKFCNYKNNIKKDNSSLKNHIRKINRPINKVGTIKKINKTSVYLPTGRRRRRFGSGRFTGIASIISGGVNQ